MSSVYAKTKFTDYQYRYLFTMDICSLYTNIPTAEGLAALKYYLEYYPDDNRPSTPTLLKLTELVLNLSSFEFDGKYYIQKTGVAMGTKMGPSYACLFVGYVEEKMLLTYTGTKLIMLRRYIDDYFGISTSTKNELEDFMQYVNDFHPSLSYTYDISDTSVNFLDISISMTHHGLTTDIFYKDTDTHSYLRYESAHPPSCKKGIPYSQFLRLRRICNNDQTFERRSDEMSEFFSQRGFPVSTIKNSLRKASKFTQSEAINKRKNLNTGIPLTMKFSGITKCIAKTIKSNLNILSANHKTNRIFGTNSVFVAFKREKNLRDCFIRSKLYRDDNTAKTPGTTSCHRPRCNTCSHVTLGNTIRGPLRNWNVLGSYTCISSNVIYAITCTRCETIYFGETKRRLADRFTEHHRAIKLNFPGLPVASHFNSSGHSIFNARVSVVTSCINDTHRKTEEERLIYNLGTLEPRGMNVRFNSFPVSIATP